VKFRIPRPGRWGWEEYTRSEYQVVTRIWIRTLFDRFSGNGELELSTNLLTSVSIAGKSITGKYSNYQWQPE